MNHDELSHLETISEVSLYAAGVNTDTIKYSFEKLKRYLTNKNILEMGPAEGVMTQLLFETGNRLTVVEGSSTFCTSISERFSTVKVNHSLFEDFTPTESFDVIVLGHVLEHVENPVDILARAKNWLTPNGIIFAAVPNARSIHRQAAVIMGLLSQEDELNEMDHHHGHRRVFTPESFRAAFTQAGLEIDIFGGYWLKPVSNSQIEKTWTPEMLNAFMKLGERYPDIAGEIYVIASNTQ